jgi:hypothetical protein
MHDREVFTFASFQSHKGATINPSEINPDYSPSAVLVQKKHLLSETTSTGIPAFPWRLHGMLGAAAQEGFENIVSWQPCGLAFKVHDTRIFTESIMPRHLFNQTQYKSFQRQLNIYGFRRLTSGSKKGAYTHEFLIRGKPEVCRFMVRTKIKEKGSRPTKLGSRSSTNLVGQSSCGGEKLCTKRTVSCPATETIRTPTANKSAIKGAPNQAFHLLNVPYMNNGAPKQGLFNNLLNEHAKSKPQQEEEEEEEPREKFTSGLCRRRSMDFNPSCASADFAEIEALPFDPSSSQKLDNSFSGISNETTGDPIDIGDLDSRFKEPSEDNMTLSSPRSEQDFVDFPIALDIADEIIKMFS